MLSTVYYKIISSQKSSSTAKIIPFLKNIEYLWAYSPSFEDPGDVFLTRQWSVEQLHSLHVWYTYLICPRIEQLLACALATKLICPRIEQLLACTLATKLSCPRIDPLAILYVSCVECTHIWFAIANRSAILHGYTTSCGGICCLKQRLCCFYMCFRVHSHARICCQIGYKRVRLVMGAIDRIRKSGIVSGDSQ